MFEQGLIHDDSDISDDEAVFPFLAVVLRGYGHNPFEWESFLRVLLRKKMNLHPPVARWMEVERINETLSPTYPCEILKYGTPLDELLRETSTPFEGEAAANRWLGLLSSEGYDVRAYLEQEADLHAEQMQLTSPSSR